MSNDISPRTVGRFLKATNATRDTAFELTFSEAARLSKDEPLFEMLEEGKYYVPFIDCDHYCETIEKPPQGFIDDVEQKLFRNLSRLINDQFDSHNDCFRLATRHGVQVQKKVYKLSFRVYFCGYVITMAEMKKAIVRKGLDQAGVGSLDISPYNKNQLLGCVGFIKSKIDRRVLEPYGTDDLEGFMVQNITGNEVVLKYDNEDDETRMSDTGVCDGSEVHFEGARFAPPWEILMLLVMSLDVSKRCDRGSYKAWTEVGWAIAGVARVANRSDDGLQLWLQFCRQCIAVYVQDHIKPIVIYELARNKGPQLGWKSLMEWLKEDNTDVFNDVRGRLGSASSEVITDMAIQNQIREFLWEAFRCRQMHLIDMSVVRYDDGKKYIIAESCDSCCPIIKNEHPEKSRIYFVIGLKNAKEKCRHKDCSNKHGLVTDSISYSAEVKNLVGNLLKVTTEPEEIAQNLLSAYKDDYFSPMMDGTIGQRVSNAFGDRFELPNNRYCMIHKCYHDNPENCLVISQKFDKMGVTCLTEPFSFYPPDGISVPQNVINILNQVVVNNHYAEEQLDEEIFNEEFSIFPDQRLNRLVNISLRGFASDIARVFVYLGRNLFGVQSGDRDTWWAWDETEKRWMQSAHKANIFCDETVAYKYTEVVNWLRVNTPDDDKRCKRLHRIEQLLKRLKDRDQHSILAQAAIQLKDEKRQFELLLDSNKDIINFRGQIFDFDMLQLREVRPTDYISLSTGYSLPELDTGKRTFVMNIIRSIMPDDNHVDYLMTWLASCLDGWNREENFHIMSGCGRNGKGILRDLIAAALGDGNGYYKSVVAALFTKERPSSDRPCADLLNMKGKRLLIGSEPELGSKINCGFLKFLTGNDPINGRWLQSNAEISFSPQHSLALLCNNIPSLDANDEAVWDRSRILEFPFKFVDKVTKPHHRKIDRSIKSALPKLGPHFMLVLLEYYAHYKKEGLHPTPQMLINTQDVRNENDIYAEYIGSFLELTTNKDDRLMQTDVEKDCMTWIKTHPMYKSRVDFDKKALKASLINAGAVFKDSVRFLIGHDANQKAKYSVRQGYENLRYRTSLDSNEDVFVSDE